MSATSIKNYYGKGTVQVPAEDGQTVYRLAIAADKLVTQPLAGIDVIPDIVAYAARTHGTKDAVGWRDVLDIHEEAKEVKKVVGGKEVTETKKWKYFELSEYRYHTFVDFQSRVSELARGLVKHGMTREDVFNVYSQTSANWQLVSHACTSISTAVATAYDTLGEAGLTHSLNEPHCAGVFTNAELLPTLAKVLPNTPAVRLVVYDGDAKPALLEQLRAAREGVVVLSIEELREAGAGEPAEALAERRPKPEDVALIMYTSGSTGAPKGVVLTHANIVAAVGAVYVLLGHHLRPEDTFLAYLPLAHILEYIVELSLFFVGMKTGYGRVKTLTDASVRRCKGDIVTFKPSIMVGVPAVWELIRKGILGKVNSGGSIRKSVFNGALAAKKSNFPVLSQVADAAVLSNVRAATGGNLRIALSGGAALSRETQEFLSVALVMMLQGYGMTESCGMCAVLPPELMQYGSVGLPMPSTEIKLADVPEAGYLSSNSPPQGEVCIRGPSVTKGYYKRDDLNDDESIFTKDGWLRTGDVGQFNADGTLTLIDRIKNLVKLQGGEYIALESLESTYKSSNLVSNICLYATADAKQPIAIVFPHESNLRQTLKDGKAIAGADAGADELQTLCAHAGVKELVLKDLNAVGKKNGFRPMEMLQAVVLTEVEWTAENGLVTAAQKIQRSKISKKYEGEIKEAYKGQ
ncbi:long-chain-fatty-acid-CoA-ligase [Coniophora puteana RWD-64-598 SS2]|uniref:Long-chain-fatty-acid-CoA-ligase n=1 Tax=Coniophora puteana (strain RWD-64-598) TaxID=741705 RepID=A0A5M3MCA7_CONPW|nr:long-chain-fatty-acid-CoA-ligase [Coniophora puteana RWD-64-598 SS2]EIW76882.1 long-chain-fatty-acid-CoA-ligase [Coniophora puteana RWD-64-598 SS2]